jgi:hypothetical protein
MFTTALGIKFLTNTLGYELDKTDPSENESESPVQCKQRYRLYVPWANSNLHERVRRDASTLKQVFEMGLWWVPGRPYVCTTYKVPRGAGVIQYCLDFWDVNGNKYCEFVYVAGPKPCNSSSSEATAVKMTNKNND